MIDSLIVLNNYFNDLFVSMVFLSALFTRIAVRLSGDSKAASVLAFEVRKKLVTVFRYSLVFFVIGLVVRIWSMPEFEFADAERNGQMLALKAKYVLLSVLVVVGVALQVLDFGADKRKPLV